MTEIKTAREILAYIEKKFFKGAGLAKASLLEGEEAIEGKRKLNTLDRLINVLQDAAIRGKAKGNNIEVDI